MIITSWLKKKTVHPKIIKLIKTVKILKKSKYELKTIKSEIIIYDNRNFETLTKIFKDKKVNLLHSNYEFLNIKYIFIAILKSFFNKKKINLNYFLIFIKRSEAKLVITNTDNDHKFFLLKHHLPDVHFIAIQFAWRTDLFSEVFGGNVLKCNSIFIFGKNNIAFYNKYNIKSNYIVLGSMLNNHYTHNNNEKLKKTILYISQFRKKPNKSQIFFLHNSTPILYENFYFPEISIIRFIEKWAQKNNYSFHICGSLTDESDEEKLFFENILQDKSFTFHPKENLGSSYHLIDRASIVAFCDSTLGYESLRRGNKTAAFTCRSGSIGCEEYRFGWPGEFPNNGAFWTNEINENEFERILNYLQEIDQESWLDVVNNTLSDIISYDENNSILKNYVNNLLKGDIGTSDN